MSVDNRPKGTLYHIIVKGSLDNRWAGWFDGFILAPLGKDATLLRGRVADQAALYGVLGKINNLGLPLVLVARVDPGEAGERCPLCGQPLDPPKEG